MRIFVTGASGWIGSAAVAELLAARHTVVGLARSDAAAAAIEAAGAQPRRGDIGDLDTLRAAAEASDAVVHLAFRHDVGFSGDFDTAVKSDLTAIEAFGEALEHTNKPLVIASGLANLKPGAVIAETDDVAADGAFGRVANERAALALAERGVRAISIRFAPTVHGDGDNGFIRLVVQADARAGFAAYIGDGSNRWPAVHRSDAARLIRLAIENAPAGSILHAAAEEGVALRDIAEAIGAGLNLPAQPIAAAEAPAHFGFLAGFLGLDIPASSAVTRELLNWAPTGPTLLDDLAQRHYYAAAT